MVKETKELGEQYKKLMGTGEYEGQRARSKEVRKVVREGQEDLSVLSLST